MSKLPKRFLTFIAEYPEIGAAYRDLGNAVDSAGPLDAKTQALIKLGMSIGSAHEGAARSQTRKCLAAGATPEELRHAVLQAITTLGFPSMMRAMTWVEDVIAEAASAKLGQDGADVVDAPAPKSSA